MLRGVSSLLGLFFVTAGFFAVASMTKTNVSPAPRPSGASTGPRRLGINTLAYHALPSLN
jgi:hypothetical protein